MNDVMLTMGMSRCLYSLQNTADQMTDTNYRLATGKAINSALDDPVNYFSAQDHVYRAGDLDNRVDEMNEAIQLVTAANDAVEAILDLIDSAQSLANSALVAEDATEIASLEDSFNEVLEQIDELASDAFYKGTNLLGGVTEQLTVYFDEDGTSNMELTGFDGSSSGLGLVDPAGSWDDGSGAPSDTGIQATLDLLTAATNTLRTESKNLSINVSTIEIRLDFTENMINTLSDGASMLTSADTNEESATLLVLETQQQLALNSLSIASDSYSNVLSLFN